jgi:hypothetical protein
MWLLTIWIVLLTYQDEATYNQVWFFDHLDLVFDLKDGVIDHHNKLVDPLNELVAIGVGLQAIIRPFKVTSASG